MARINTHLGSAKRNRLRFNNEIETLKYLGAAPHPAPSADPPASHASESAGYHYEGAIPHHTETPLAAPTASQAATGPAGDYAGARRAYGRAVLSLPPPLAPLPAPFAPPTSLVSTNRPSFLSMLTGLKPDLPQTEDPAKAIISSQGKSLDVEDPLGKKTLGDVTAEELLAAGRAGTLKIGAGGQLSTPEVRSAIGGLKDAQQRFIATARPDFTGLLDPQQAKVAKIILDEGVHSGATPKELLAAAETGLVESNFRNLGYGDADSEGWRQERTSIYGTGPTGPRDVRASAGRFFDESISDTGGTRGAGQTAGELAQTIQGSAFPERYDQVKPEAAAVLRAYQQGKPEPQATQALKVAKQNVRAEGINPTPFNGDVDGGGPNFVTVRADAKGMVQWLESAVGTQEGTPKQHHWADKFALGYTEPWCANFVSNGLTRRGITNLPSNPNYVPSYEQEWGPKYGIGTDLSKAKPGDLLTFSGTHIGVYVGSGEMTSGNSSDAVSRTDIPSGLSMIIRPPYKGGKVKIEESAVVPGSTAASALGSTSTAGVAGAAPVGGGSAGPTSRPSIGLTPITAPLAAGPVTPAEVSAGADEHVESAAENLIAMLGEGGLGGRRPIL